MALKTLKNKKSVSAFLKSIENERRRKDGQEMLKIMKDVTGMKPALWGDALVGFGSYHYKSERSTQEGD